MSPEQARGQNVDKRADIWAFGVILWEMLSGEKLFDGKNTTDILFQVLSKEPEFGRLPASVRPLLESCLEKDAKKRLRDIGDAWRLLEYGQLKAAIGRGKSRRPAWLIVAIAALAAALTMSL